MAQEGNMEGRNSPGRKAFVQGLDFYESSPERPLTSEGLLMIDRVFAAVNTNDTFALTQEIGFKNVISTLTELVKSLAEGRIIMNASDNPLQRHLKALETTAHAFAAAKSDLDFEKLDIDWAYHQMSFLDEAGFEWNMIASMYQQGYRTLPRLWDTLNKAALRRNQKPIFNEHALNS